MLHVSLPASHPLRLATGGSAGDWLVVQAYEKPLINLVWIGIIILSLGFVLAIYRRTAELKIA